jgi:hypothetical protein
VAGGQPPAAAAAGEAVRAAGRAEVVTSLLQGRQAVADAGTVAHPHRPGRAEAVDAAGPADPLAETL